MKRKIIYLLILVVSTYFAWSFTKSKISQPTIGGNFNLVNQFEEQVSLDNFKDDYLLIYFGYTFCPDVCPLSVNEMLLTKKLLRKVGKKITPVFITVDPERDNVENIKSFAEKFDNEIVCLTGSEKEISRTTKKFRIYVKKAEDAYENNQYLVDHTSIFYIFDTNGKFLKHFSHGSSSEEMYQYLKNEI